MCFGFTTFQSPFSKISSDSGTFSNFMAEFSNGRRPLFCTFVLILFQSYDGRHIYVPVFLPMVLQILQDYASLFGLQNYASPSLCIKIHSRNLRFSSHT